MKETLTCTACGKNWKRELVRGRKPKLCAKCAADYAKPAPVDPAPAPKRQRRSVEAQKVSDTPPSQLSESKDPSVDSSLDLHDIWDALTPRPRNWKEIKQSTANGSKWQCPHCKMIISVEISLIDIPIHKCNPASNKTYRLERIS
jgi:hypothetical protein